MTRRTEQIEATLRREVGQLLEKGLADPRIKGLVSVTGVRLTDDRHTAVISVSVFPAEHGRGTVHALQHAAKHLRHELTRHVQARQIPRLQFRLDESLKHQARVIQAINEAVGPDRAEADDAPHGPDEPAQENPS